MIASTFWDVTVPRVMTIFANTVFAALWVGLILTLTANGDLPEMLWDWVQALPLVPRIIMWVLLLPIMVGVWIWQSDWSSFGRLLGLAGIIGWNLLAVSSIFKTFRKV
jgi:hypothetical protein